MSRRNKVAGMAGCLALLLIGLAACAAHLERKSALQPEDLKQRGVVIGGLTSRRVVGILGGMDGYGGHDLTVTDIRTGERYVYPDADYFQYILAPGDYALTRIGLAGKDLVPKDAPFRFTVAAGVITYVGTIATDRDEKEGIASLGKEYVLVDKVIQRSIRHERAPEKVRPREITLYVAEDKAAAEKMFRSLNPALARDPVVEDLMR